MNRLSIRSLAHTISQIQPGQWIVVSGEVLRECDPTGIELLAFPGWTMPDRILDNIVGSAYEFRYWRDGRTGDVVFSRLPQPLSTASGLRSYVSPDLRDRFRLRSDALYETPSVICPKWDWHENVGLLNY